MYLMWHGNRTNPVTVRLSMIADSGFQRRASKQEIRLPPHLDNYWALLQRDTGQDEGVKPHKGQAEERVQLVWSLIKGSSYSPTPGPSNLEEKM